MSANELEQLVWADCEEFLRDPGKVVELLRTQQAERQKDATTAASQRTQLAAALAAKDSERQTIIRLARRGAVRDDEAEAQLHEIAAEERLLHHELELLDAHLASAAHEEQQHLTAEALLLRCRAKLDAGLTYELQREIVRTLVDNITVLTEGSGRSKRGLVQIRYAFRDPDEATAIEASTGPSSGDLRTA